MKDSKNENPFKIVQISDSHLFAETQGKLLGLNTEESLLLVLDLLRTESESMDVVLATGDISQDGSLSSYERFYKHLGLLQKPIYSLPGNHDELVHIEKIISDTGRVSPCVIEQGGWRVILLDSTIENKVLGELSPVQLSFLDKVLAGSKDFYVMVVLHHHPIPLNSQWLDSVGLRNPQALFKVLDCYPCVQALVWGHVHQAFEGVRNKVKLFSSPSTCVQFKPGSQEFAVDDKSPGYRWFHLYEDGRIDSGVSRVEGVQFEVDYSVKGY